MNLLENYQQPRYKSAIRGSDFHFKAQSKFGNYMRDQTPNHNINDTSRGESNMSRVSKASWTNISYNSNFSAIRNDIRRFKNKPKKNEKRGSNLTTINLTRFESRSPTKVHPKKV